VENKALRHLVCVRFKPETSAAEIAEIEREFSRLPQLIDGIERLVAGCNESVEGKDRGVTHVWELTFESVAARDRYLTHPDHLAFSRMLAPLQQEVLVFDYPVPEA
jgi:stress responsive alpha/beta barrel protein